MAQTARDIMQTDVISVSPEEALVQVHRLFVESEISGAPVVDGDGQVLGVISATDLLRTVADEEESAAAEPHYFRESMEFSGPDWGSIPEDFQDRLAQLTAEDAMNREVITITPDTGVAEIARTMRFHRIHRVLVQEDGRLAGIVTSFDLIGVLEKAGD